MKRRATSGRARRVGRAAALLTATAPMLWLAGAPALASAQHSAHHRSATHSAHSTRSAGAPLAVTVGDVSEAWYADSPIDVCSTPLGCPPQPVPSSPYPPDTLHVGVAGGQETARTYVQPNLLGIPFGSTLVTGTMTLPLAADGQSGNSSPATAHLLACAAKAPAPDGTQGSTSKAPDIDCATASPAKYDAKRGLFTVDLKPFLTAWSTGNAPGIALVPDPKGTQPTDAWHVAFNGHKRAKVKHISSTFTYTPLPSTGGTQPVPTPPASVPSAPSVSQPGPVNLPPPSTTTTQPAAPPVVATPQTPTVAPQTQPVALVRPFQYPLAFLMPLALLVGAVFFARLFTRDPTPIRLR
ncbi:MAG: hypothetical protein JO222_14220 [Frankiales bacterium]|nr:hypothetical protein [Frankiales bacterium]